VSSASCQAAPSVRPWRGDCATALTGAGGIWIVGVGVSVGIVVLFLY